MIKLKVFVFNLIWINSILAFKVCDQDASKNGPENYPAFAKSVNDILEKFDGVVIDSISATLPTIKYDLRDLKVTGVNSCKVVMMNTCKEHSNFQFDFECAKFQVDEQYDMKGYIKDVYVEGKGKGIVTCYKYVMKNTAFLKKPTDDNKKYIQIDDYHLDIQHNDKVVFDFQNLFGDKEKSNAVNKYLNEDFATTDETLRGPILRTFMDKLIENLNGLLKTTPVDQILPGLV